MALKPRNRVLDNFAMSGMTDIVFLLLIFFMLTSTLIAPNALKMLLPSRGQVTIQSESQIPTVTITAAAGSPWMEELSAWRNLAQFLSQVTGHSGTHHQGGHCALGFSG